VTRSLITIDIVVVVAHCPAAGVNVYVVVPTVPVLIVPGFQVPVILLVDVVGNDGAVAFKHRLPICVNVGATALVITMVIVVVAPWPGVGVKV
jgi:hypothetical protein